ncbi:MAG: phosphoribosyltransferase family protein [Planctomycetia bacterium]|nr:phosphoribosyltransferase family protein [Planctomycetia bacterium]RLT14348.1 MAG: ComF family protein [Planctomycetota bacterium]
MAWLKTMRQQGACWAGRGIDLLFPPRCVFCRQDIPSDNRGHAHDSAAGRPRPGTICDQCVRDLSSDVSRCLGCGEACSSDVGCRRCRSHRDWDGIVVLAGYGDRVRDAVLRAKHPAGDDTSRALAEIMVEKHRDTLMGWGIDGIVPVPMHWLRRACRGTSAADELAQRIADLMRVPYQRLLVRRRATRMQNELPIEERRDNLQAAFRARRRVDGKSILLVDDVVTSGATLATCRQAIVSAGAKAVFAAVVAKADRSSLQQ